MAREKVSSAKELIEKFKDIKSKFKNQHNKEIPCFEKIIKILNDILKFKDIANAIKILKDLEKYCRISPKKYSNEEIMPILSLFTVTINFLESQQENGRLTADFEYIKQYFNSKTNETSTTR